MLAWALFETLSYILKEFLINLPALIYGKPGRSHTFMFEFISCWFSLYPFSVFNCKKSPFNATAQSGSRKNIYKKKSCV